jgi:hypothetical protein
MLGSPRWGINCGERNVREFVSIHHATCPGVCLIVVGNKYGI